MGYDDRCKVVDTADARHVKAQAGVGACLEIAQMSRSGHTRYTGNLFLGFQLSVGDSVRPAG